MKTTRSNSFRLHRISKTNSLRKAHDSQYINSDDLPFKLQAINSINKGVKYNDLSFITGRDLNKLRKQPSSQTDIAMQSAHMNMNDMRKKYDDVKKKTLSLQESIFHLKEEKQKYELRQNDFNGGKNKGKQKVQNMQTDLQQKKILLELTETEKKVLLSLVSRHKSDKVFYDQSKFNLEQQYSHLKKQLKIFAKEGTQIGQNTDRTSKVYEKFLKQLQAQKKEREQHLYNVQKLLFTKASVLQANQTRGFQIQEIAQRAMLDKNMNEKQWQKIFLTHTFLNKMLRNKIQRQMQKFRVVQFAFKEIKTATGVNDAQLLVKKYLNKEEVYGQLLSKISQNEKQIQTLRNQTQRLLTEQKSLESEKQVLQNTKVVRSDLHDHIKELQFYQEKRLASQLQQTKLLNWLERQLKKFQLLDKKIGLSKEEKSIPTLFKLYVEKMSDSLIKANQIQVQSASTFGVNLQSDKVVRILPKKSRQNSKGEQIFDVDEEETNTSNLAEQQDIVAIQREEVLRSNEKFMKEMRKKREEMKKVLIQAMEKDKKQKEKPKAEIKRDD